ncbi:MAG: tRNA (adenosine(37)-N6)-threonylcarbamoyltransferase complex dimerization subunit type 1 TsaB [Proteobacteria bacterium]|nr:tRNA (adenosine(37)-N6)-threonylcarbamoyltransferase complex dimerization subunit type 1 TsaB [Pseudomonadota bacterium]
MRRKNKSPGKSLPGPLENGLENGLENRVADSLKILAVDTASQSCGVAIVHGDTLLCEICVNTGDTHSKQVLSLMDTALGFSELKLTNIDAYAVTTGPGSFTGLRIGMSVLKGIVLADKKPIVGISSLDALAWQCNPYHGAVCVLMDARRKEVYCAQYTLKAGLLKRTVQGAVVNPEKAISAIHEECAFIGSGAVLYRNLILEKLGEKAFFPSASSHLIKASSVAFLGLEQLQNRQSKESGHLVPEYLRASDAEIKRIGKG